MKKKKTVWAALLDERGIYQGMEELAEDALTDRHLAQIKACDLTPGGYRWEAEEGNPFGGKFVPLPKKQSQDALKEPNTLRAVVRGFESLQQQGMALPRETTEWLAWCRRSMDLL